MNPDHQIKSRVEVRSYPAEAQSHHHDFHQIVLPCSGRLELDIAGRGGYVEEGRGVVIAAGEEHAFAATPNNTFIVMDMPLASAGRLGLPNQLSTPRYFQIAAGAGHLMQHFLHSTATRQLPIDLGLSWSALLLDSIGLVRRDEVATGRTEHGLRRAQLFMSSNFRDAIGVDDIAKAAAMSEASLFAAFRQRLKTSPNTILTRLRLDEAHRLLTSTRLSIAEIALKTGFSDQSALTRRMHQVDGVTPAQVRRQSGIDNLPVVVFE